MKFDKHTQPYLVHYMLPITWPNKKPITRNWKKKGEPCLVVSFFFSALVHSPLMIWIVPIVLPFHRWFVLEYLRPPSMDKQEQETFKNGYKNRHQLCAIPWKYLQFIVVKECRVKMSVANVNGFFNHRNCFSAPILSGKKRTECRNRNQTSCYIIFKNIFFLLRWDTESKKKKKKYTDRKIKINVYLTMYVPSPNDGIFSPLFNVIDGM